MTNAIFLDIDGTILPFGASAVPESTVQAIKKAREKGNLVFINTGRCRIEVVESICEIGFDGIICSNAMYIEENGAVLHEENLESATVRRISDFLSEKHIGFFLEGQRVVCASPLFFPQIVEIAGESVSDAMKKQFPCVKENALVFDGISKVNFFNKNNIAEHARAFFGDTLQINEWSLIGDRANMGEMTKPNANKTNGVDLMLARHHIERAHSFSFGDTNGDLGMIQRCGTGVAMGNAVQSLKDAADFVTDDVDKDGIYNAFKRFDFI